MAALGARLERMNPRLSFDLNSMAASRPGASWRRGEFAALVRDTRLSKKSAHRRVKQETTPIIAFPARQDIEML